MGRLENLLEKQHRYEATLREKNDIERRLERAKKGAFRQIFDFFGEHPAPVIICLIIAPFVMVLIAGLVGSLLMYTISADTTTTTVVIPVVVVSMVLALLIFILAPWLIVVVSKPARIRRLEKKLAQTEKELSKIDPVAIEKEIKLLQKEARSSGSSKSGVENTDYYKEKFNEYYNTYMGNPQSEKKSDTNTDALGDHMRTHYGDNWGDY